MNTTSFKYEDSIIRETALQNVHCQYKTYMTYQSLDLSVSWYKESLSSTELGPYHLALKSEDSKHKALLQNLVEHFRKTCSVVNFLHLVTNSMQQGPSCKANNNSSPTKEIHQLLGN
jgi:hypothetical protein